MPRHSAKVLEPGDVQRMLVHVDGLRHPRRNRVIVLLSFKAGLRACEIAGLRWSMVLTSSGAVDETLAIAADIAKMGAARRLPLHHDLSRALKALHRSAGHPREGPVVRSERDGHMTARSIVNWFAGIYRVLDLQGCSSHSGRRTFITQAARLVAKTGGSLRDVQELAGHRAITTTERYIEGDRASQRKLISLL